MKPRTSASAIGIRSASSDQEVWRVLEELGDEQSNFLLEQYIPGDVFHVDSVCWHRHVLTQAVHRYGAPPMTLMQQGGVFTTRTVDPGSTEGRALRAMDAAMLPALGMVSGVTHSEYILGHDGSLYFLETAARVGGAYIAELLEYSTGRNPWREWARIEAAMALGRPFTLSAGFDAFAGSVLCLARQEHPDLSAFDAPEVVFHMNRHHHAGLIVQSASERRVAELLQQYSRRFQMDFCASMPAPDRPTS